MTYPKDLTYSLSVESISAIMCCSRLLEDREVGGHSGRRGPRSGPRATLGPCYSCFTRR